MITVLANVARFMGRVRDCLERRGRAPKLTDEVYFQPYLDVLRSLAAENHWSTSDLEVLGIFTEIWDTKVRQFLARERMRMAFSTAEVSSMSTSVVRGEAWLRRYLE